MGGVPRPAAGGVGRGLGSLGAGRFAAESPQAPARPEEAEAQEAERGQDQTRCHREASPSASYMYKMTPPRGLGSQSLTCFIVRFVRRPPQADRPGRLAEHQSMACSVPDRVYPNGTRLRRNL